MNTVIPPLAPDINVFIPAVPVIQILSPVMARDDPALKNIQQKYSDNVDKTMYVILHGSNSKALSLLNL